MDHDCARIYDLFLDGSGFRLFGHVGAQAKEADSGYCWNLGSTRYCFAVKAWPLFRVLRMIRVNRVLRRSEE